MNLHEYQAKETLAKFGVQIQRGKVAATADEAVEAAKSLTEETGTSWHVIKAQVHAGGRGKGGGVKLAKSLEEVKEKSGDILGMQLVTPQTKAEGGMDIEEVAEKHPDKIFKEVIDPAFGLQGFQARRVAFNLGLSGKAFKEMVKFVSALYKAYVSIDASLFEINPVLKTSDDKIMAVDAKVTLDGNALFRHPDLAALRDEREEDPTEVEAGKAGLNFVKLDGNVGCMVNGAGLAMATMDMIKLSGGSPANFLDVGGTADAERVEKAFRIILKDEG
ncbi:unnamed protein product, partial [Cyprideis torosa]